MALKDTVKQAIGVFYSETNKDNEIQRMIDGAIAYFKNAGWDVQAETTDPLAIEAIILFCKMSHSTDVSKMTNHPVLISFIAQGRALVTEVVVEDV